MRLTLAVYCRLYREQFDEEHYCGRGVLAVIESGSFSVEMPDGPAVLGPLEAFYFAPGVFYDRKVLEPLVVHLFRFEGPQDLLPPGKVVFQDTDRVRSTLGLLTRLRSGLYSDDFTCSQSLFSDLITQYRIENGTVAVEDEIADPVARSAAIYLRQNLQVKLNLPELAARHGLSYVQFARRFRTAVGMTLSDYLSGQRMQKARHLLEETDLPIKVVADECGFGNEYYFSGFFKKRNSVSPSAYRAGARAVRE